MRISDWSSDVCSSDLFGGIVYDPSNYAQNVLTAARSLQAVNNQIRQIENQAQSLINQAKNLTSLPVSTLSTLQQQVQQTRQLLGRSEEHTSELQSLMRISYAVFCLKKKKQTHHVSYAQHTYRNISCIHT